MNRKMVGIETVKPRSHLAEYFLPIVHDRDKFSNREQSETNRNDENAMCDYLSEYIRMCFRLYEDPPRLSLTILQTLCKQSKIAGIYQDKMRTVSEKYANISKYYMDDTVIFSIKTITVLIGFRLFAIAQQFTVSIINNRKNIRLNGTWAKRSQNH